MHLTESLRPSVRETFFSGTHESGLEVLLNPKPGFSRQIAILATRFGSLHGQYVRHDRFVDRGPAGGGTAGGGTAVSLPGGLAHFLEHELFTKKSGDISARFARYGAVANAGTGFTSTSYYVSCTQALQQNLELLFELVFRPYFDEENVRRERRVIEQEIRLYGDNPDWRLYMNLLESLYHRHPIRIDIAGTEETIAGIDTAVLEEAYRTFYHPSNMILIVAGNVAPERTADHVEELLASMQFGPAPAIHRLLPEEPREIVRPVFRESHAVGQAKTLLGYKDPEPPARGPATVSREVRMNMLLHVLFGCSASAYQRLYDAGLIDDSFNVSYSSDDGCGLATLGGDTDEPERLCDAVRTEIERVRRAGFDPQDLERTRQKLLGRFFFGFNSPESTASTLLNFWNKGSHVWDYPETVTGTTTEHLEQLLESQVQPRYSAASHVVPDSSSRHVPLADSIKHGASVGS